MPELSATDILLLVAAIAGAIWVLTSRR